jgi:hypothetical protein
VSGGLEGIENERDLLGEDNLAIANVLTSLAGGERHAESEKELPSARTNANGTWKPRAVGGSNTTREATRAGTKNRRPVRWCFPSGPAI